MGITNPGTGKCVAIFDDASNSLMNNLSKPLI